MSLKKKLIVDAKARIEFLLNERAEKSFKPCFENIKKLKTKAALENRVLEFEIGNGFAELPGHVPNQIIIHQEEKTFPKLVSLNQLNLDKLRNLNLSGAFLNDISLRLILPNLTANSSNLEIINFNKNKITDIGVRYICNALFSSIKLSSSAHFKKLRKLSLRQNELNLISVLSLVRVVNNLSNFRTLDVRQNCSLSDDIKKVNKKIKDLYLKKSFLRY
eukprot:snap_masked-scaffold_33-processed-gene-3.14-mRNA-1 protein AED:1.00 eAED:1.00 QI:0/-1/0/0/-1/1/1/0/218